MREGYDADLVVWDDYPLAVGAKPINVWIGGLKLYSDDELIKPKNLLDGIPKAQQREVNSKYNRYGKGANAKARAENEKLCEETRRLDGDLIIKGIQKSFLNRLSHLESESETSTAKNLTLIVKSSKFSCLGDCGTDEQAIAVNENTRTIWLGNGHVTPPITTLLEGLGQIEIKAEGSTSVGTFKGEGFKNAASVTYTKDSLVFGGKMMGRARYGGVYRAITPPLSSGFLAGVSAAFKTDGKSLLENGTVVKGTFDLRILNMSPRRCCTACYSRLRRFRYVFGFRYFRFRH